MSQPPMGGSFNSATSGPSSKQAGVGLLLAETENSNMVIVKQVVPRGSADRTRQVRVGDFILKVGGHDVVGMGVTDIRNIIVGEQGTRVPIRFRRPENNEVFEIELVRGTPEFLDQGGAYGSAQPAFMQQQPGYPQGPSIYQSGGARMPQQNVKHYMLGTTWSQEMFNQPPPPQPRVSYVDPARALQDENEWLRSALRMAESTMMRHRQDLGACREQFVTHKVDCEANVKKMEEANRAKDDERRDAEQALLSAEEYRRSLEVRLREAQRRSEWMRETDAQIQDNERARVDYLSEVKRRAEMERVDMEQELRRLQEDLEMEKAARQEAEQRESSLRSDFNRLADHRVDQAGGTRDTRSSFDTNIGESFRGQYAQGSSAQPQAQSELMLA
uniref:PDZ domain-containing protein n=1 Tax=Hemiselmis andersenii TaxID=464988 RepID=A0A7S0TK26_HEMAN